MSLICIIIMRCRLLGQMMAVTYEVAFCLYVIIGVALGIPEISRTFKMSLIPSAC
jgi:hypothetical protein